MTRLKRAFLDYNQRWFNGKLAPDTIVRWAEMDEMGTSTGQLILVNRKLRRWDSAWKLTLFHEMAHVATDSEVAEHGPRWLRVMRSLARRGAFDKLW